MKKHLSTYIFYIGIGAFAAGLVLNALFGEMEGAIRTLSFVLTGFGTGIIIVGVINNFRIRRLKNDPEKAKQLEIDETDERNIRLREKAGYATWHSTMFIFAALTIAFSVLDNKIAFWVTLGALFVHIFSFNIFISVYNKKI
jgi:anaerobic C4-dicarboxylate transporter